MSKYRQENKEALKDVDFYVGNPLNAYLLVKRLIIDWKEVELLMGLNNRKIVAAGITVYKEHPKYPTLEDLNGTIEAITRLQETYNLDTTLMAGGEINKNKYSSELSASDCFEIGRLCFENQKFHCSYSWLVEADARIMRDSNTLIKINQRILILEYMAVSLYKLGSASLVLHIINKILYMVPDHAEALKKKAQYENDIQQHIESTNKKNTQELKLYQKLCNEAITPSIEFNSKLKCRYADNNNSFLFLAPFKMEDLSLQPKIVLFHDVITNEEIEILKEFSISRFETAAIVCIKSNALSSTRIGKVVWFSESYNKYVKHINRRVSHMTGLSIKTAEPLQVANYGVGGHFITHLDYPVMSDDFQGGGTVFTVPKLYIKPKKGAAVFWYHLHTNGDGDNRTLHRACPVLTGSKWVSNKWLFEHGQEFLRPCEVNRYATNNHI